MKGLLIKDFSIMAKQKKFGVMFILLSIFLGYSMEPSFVIAYMPVIAMSLAFSTMAYDDLDNGMAFLMALPGSRKNYTIEKYLFSGIVIALAWLVGVVVSLVMYTLKKESFSMGEVMGTDLMLLLLILIMCCVILPIILKYGNEKGRIVLFAVFGVGILIAVGGKEIVGFLQQKLGGDITAVIVGIKEIPIALIMAVVAGICLLSFFVSFAISNGIMKKKEF